MSTQLQPLPNIQHVKRQIQFQNYRFNQQQINLKHQKFRRFKSQQQQQQTFMNYRAIHQLEDQKYKEIKKKYTVQNLLQNQYEKQIFDRKRIKTEQKSYDKVYSERQKLMLEYQQRNRIKQLGRIYNIGNDKKNRGSSRLIDYARNNPNNTRNNPNNTSINNRSIYNNPQQDNNNNMQNFTNNNRYQEQYQPKRNIMKEDIYIPDSLSQFKQKGLIQNLKSQYNKQQLQDRQLIEKQLKQSMPLKSSSPKQNQRLNKKQQQNKLLSNGYRQDRNQNNRSQMLQKPKYKMSMPEIQVQQKYNRYQNHEQQPIMHPQQSVGSLDNSRASKHSPVNIQYSSYLKKQIQRKNQQRQLKRQKQLQRDKQFIQRQNKAYYDSLQEMKYKKEKRKWDYALGLEKQIQLKQQRKMNNPYYVG